MHRIDDDIGEQGRRGDQDQRPNRLAALAALGAQEGALSLGIVERCNIGLIGAPFLA
jgi:hypothetical protein